jgi:hypothetical protein
LDDEHGLVAEEQESLKFMNQIKKVAGHRCGLSSVFESQQLV